MEIPNTTNTTKSYKINLDVFEGPLDLLLYLIRKDDLDIMNIPIALITEEYLRYLDSMKVLNVDIAGEYLLMAAELVQIKSRMLLPSGEGGEDEEWEEDPREELKRRLLEYQRYKEAALNLAQRPVLYRDEYVQMDPECLPGRREVLVEESAFKLLEAFQFLVRKLPSDKIQEVTVDRISVSERIFELVEILKVGQTFPLESFLRKDYSKYDLVITFLALLEMAKLMMIEIHQAGQFQKIYISGTLTNVSREEAMMLVSKEE